MKSRGRRTLRGTVLMGFVVFALGACAPTVRIRDLLDEPQRFDGKTVKVEGTVTRSVGLLGTGAYEVDDGTGTIFVIAEGSGVPREGAKTKAKGRFESVFSLAGRTIAAILQGRDSP